MSSSPSPKAVFFLLFGLIAGFGLSLGIGATISSVFVPFDSAALDTSRGKALFGKSCANCHAIQPEVIGGLGPNLHNIGDEGSQRVQGMSVEHYILESVLDPEAFRSSGSSGHMPRGTVANVEPEIVRSLVGYLTTLGGSIDKKELQSLDIDTVVIVPEAKEINVSQLTLGSNLFFRTLGCASCHGINGIPGSALRAPSLEKAGLLSEDYILNSIRNPSDVISDTWKAATVELNDGTKIAGRVLSESGDGIVLLSGNTGSRALMSRMDFDRSQIKSLEYNHKSPMPIYTLTTQDERAIVAFLRSLLAEV